MRLSVIGTGYLGAVHAACMADIGHEVLGVDSDAQKVAALQDGHAPFFEPGLEEILVRAVGSGKLRFGTSLQEAAEFADAHFICVGTPQLAGAAGADLSHIEAVVDGLAPYLTRDCLVIGKSTVPVGTAARLAARIAELAPAGGAASLAWNPEFLREGFAVEDTIRPDRIVVGITSPGADVTLRAIYDSVLELGTPYITTDLATAELVKVAANAFLATKISFINAISNVCDAAGADVMTLADALGHDTRIGRRFLSAGLGFGGGCLSKDIRAFMARADELGVGDSLQFLREVQPDQHGPAGAGRRGGPRTRRRVLRRPERSRAGCRVQARHRRCPRLACPGRGPDHPGRGRGRAGARSPGHVQRPPGLPGPGLRRGSGQGLRGGRRGAAPHRME